MGIACLLPAAGSSSRMKGTDKLLETINGKPCLAVMAERALAAKLNVIVALPSLNHPRAQALASLPVQAITIRNASLGMSASLVAGAQSVPSQAKGLMVLPPDMPAITSADITKMVEQFSTANPPILRARAKSGAPGHPVIFRKDLLPEFEHLIGDRGAQSIVNRYAKSVSYFDFEDERPLCDLDTQADWDAWRKTR